MAQFSFVPARESVELDEDVRALFEDLAASLPPDQRALSGECRPALDVLETAAAIEVVVDVSGVPATAIRVLFRDGVLVVAGEKAPPPSGSNRTFHLIEREFGRFARAVQLTGALDIQRGRAEVRHGELHVVLPKIAERRGRPHRIGISGR